ncbi:hypothetical protein AN958_11358 [Leucoagaricus sp. SymC.cos]|nr:hypothetical protein AN958_11358 [Leucoagaricus sp. SymC.cos]
MLPIVQVPISLFRKVYIDMMHMPPSYSYKYIIQAQDSLTGWVEWHTLTCETGRTLGQFIFEEILCHLGRLKKIIMNNGTAFIAALN